MARNHKPTPTKAVIIKNATELFFENGFTKTQSYLVRKTTSCISPTKNSEHLKKPPPYCSEREKKYLVSKTSPQARILEKEQALQTQGLWGLLLLSFKIN